MAETIAQARKRAIWAAKKAQDLTAGLDANGKADQDDDADAQARGLEALMAATEAEVAAVLASESDPHTAGTARAQADRAERALARVRERLGIAEEVEAVDDVRTMQMTLGITVLNTSVRKGDTQEEIAMMNRVVEAILPHPDDAIHTGHYGNEQVTVIMTDWKVTS